MTSRRGAGAEALLVRQGRHVGADPVGPHGLRGGVQEDEGAFSQDAASFVEGGAPVGDVVEDFDRDGAVEGGVAEGEALGVGDGGEGEGGAFGGGGGGGGGWAWVP